MSGDSERTWSATEAAESKRKTGGNRLGGSVEPEAAEDKFRLRSTSCLFTWNNGQFRTMCRDQLWESFVSFLKSLTFVCQWTATMEVSLKAAEQGRIHLHAFVEFFRAVDWTSLDLVKFMGGLPNASPTRARDDNQRQVIKRQLVPISLDACSRKCSSKICFV